MRKQISILIVTLIALTSCGIGKNVVVKSVEEEVREEKVDTTVIPEFPVEVLYVLAREYEDRGDTMHTMGEYVEDRLIDLYPEKAYKGMMSKVGDMSMALMQQVKRSPQYRAKPIDGLIHASKNESYYNSVSDSAEVEFMKMTKAESAAYWELNDIADGGKLGTTANIDSIKVFDSDWSLDRTIMSDTLPYFVQEKWVMSAVSLGMASSTIYRILQSKARAEYVATHYYKETFLGKKGDAYKHIFVNMLLNRYTTELGAWLVMDVYWEKQNWNAASDRIMDFHNNMVGREYRYKELTRGTDDWREWALRLRKFVEDTAKNATYMDWHLDTPELEVKQMEKNADKEKYIYWNKGDKTVQQYIDRLNADTVVTDTVK